MDLQPLASSNLAAAGYDPETRILKIAFKNGGAYAYSGVAQEVYDDLMSAGSAGQYFFRNIRGRFPYVQEG